MVDDDDDEAREDINLYFYPMTDIPQLTIPSAFPLLVNQDIVLDGMICLLNLIPSLLRTSNLLNPAMRRRTLLHDQVKCHDELS